MPTLAAAPPIRPASIVVLSGLCAASPFATDMYAPAFPRIADSLDTTGSSVQLSLTACLVGLAVGQLLLGPVSDAVGRRRLLLAGSGLFAGLSLACALAPNIAVLDVARLLQGLTAAAGLVLARVVVSDQFDGADAARRLSTLSSISMLAPVVAPVVGGLVLRLGSWRLVFVALSGLGFALLAAVWAGVPESLPVDRRRPGGWRAGWVSMRRLLARRELVGYLLVMGAGLAALFAYITGSPFVFQDGYGLSPTVYSLVYAVNAGGTVLATVLVRRRAGRTRLNVLLALGLLIAVVALLLLVALLLAGVDTLAVTWPCLFGLTFGFGIVLPTSITLILTIGSATPGAASGLIGGAQFGFSAVAAALPGIAGRTTTLSTATAILALLVVAAAALLTMARPWRGHGEP